MITFARRPHRRLLAGAVFSMALVVSGGCSRTTPEPPPAFDMSVFIAPPGATQVEERLIDEEDYRDIHGNRVRQATAILRDYRLPRTWTEAEFAEWLKATYPRPGWISLEKTTRVGSYNRFESDTVLRMLLIEPSQQSLAEYRAGTIRSFSITQEVYRVRPPEGS